MPISFDLVRPPRRARIVVAMSGGVDSSVTAALAAQSGAEVIGAELGEVLGGSHPGRTSDEQRTIYGGVGLAFQDAVAAWQVYEHAVSGGSEAYPTIDWLA